MRRPAVRTLAVAAATVALSALGTTLAFAETPQHCDKLVCLKDGTQFGAPVSAYPAESQPGAVSATQLVQDCAAAQLGQLDNISCGFYPYSDPQAVGYGDWAPLSSDFMNCYGGNDANNLNWSSSSTYTTTSTVTVTASLEVGLDEMFKTSFSTSYAHSWGTATGSTQSFFAYVPQGYKAHLQHRYQEQQATGVMWINYGHTGNKPGEGYGHHYYGITDYTATSPVKDDSGMVDDQVSMSPPQALQSGECS
ncbi:MULTISPECIES: hypothetical protein [unclassified Streptomyces]|uniref:hypothetical protein n=1 Tax=unclassified Streptomyces TaxID=2593676 RepID=UPI00324CA899